jgi:hypothetical protein
MTKLSRPLNKAESIQDYERRLREEAIKAAKENQNKKVDKYDIKK